MNDLYVIRNARRDEVERLSYIENEAAALFDGTGLLDNNSDADTFPLDLLEEFIDKGQAWVACSEDDVPIGMVIVADWRDNIHIEELDVLPDFGRRGIGTALLNHVCEWAKRSGFRTATLSTFRDIPWNQPFYRKHGFIDIAFPDLTEEQLRMREVEVSKGLDVEKRVVMQRCL